MTNDCTVGHMDLISRNHTDRSDGGFVSVLTVDMDDSDGGFVCVPVVNVSEHPHDHRKLAWSLYHCVWLSNLNFQVSRRVYLEPRIRMVCISFVISIVSRLDICIVMFDWLINPDFQLSRLVYLEPHIQMVRLSCSVFTFCLSYSYFLLCKFSIDMSHQANDACYFW